MRTALMAVLVLVGAAVLMTSLTGCRRPVTPSAAMPSETTAPPKQATTEPAPAGAEDGVGKPAPNFTVTDIDGSSHSLSDYNGKILVVDFWATYCKPCVKKLREYESLYQMYKERNVAFIALSMDESDEVIKGWRQQNDISFPLARLTPEAKQAFFGDASLVPIPQMRIVDHKRTIRYSFGPSGTTEEVENALKTLVAEKK